MKTTALAELIVSMLNKIVSILNNTVQEIETAIGEGEEDEGEATRSGKEKNKELKDAKEKGRASTYLILRPSAKDKELKDTKEKGDKSTSKENGAPSEADIVRAVRAALKVLEKKEVSKIIKKYGKADRAIEVDEELRQKVIDELEKAIDNLEKAVEAAEEME